MLEQRGAAGAPALDIQPFTPLTDAQAESLADEGARLPTFAAATARQREVLLLPPKQEAA